jgi:hypothetical protein
MCGEGRKALGHLAAQCNKTAPYRHVARFSARKGCPLHFLYGFAKKGGDADCVAGAERHFNFVRAWSATAVGGGYEMVLRCGGRGGIASGGRLLADGIRGGCCGAAADTGDRVGAVQAGDGGEIAGAAAEFSGDESANAGRYLRGYTVAGRHRGASDRGRDANSEDAVGIFADRARG